MSWKCPNCLRTLKNANQWHCCVNQDIDNLFLGKPTDLMLAFDKILSGVSAYENVEISATKNCIVFFKTQTFLVVKPMKKELNVKFYLQEPLNDYQIFKVAIYGKQHEHHIRISTPEEVNQRLFSFIKKSYKLFN